MKHLIVFLISLYIAVNSFALETVTWLNPKGEKNQITIPAKFLCKQKIIAGLLKDDASQTWNPKTVEINKQEDFILIFDKFKNFKGEDKENCDLVDKKPSDMTSEFYKWEKEQGRKLCAVTHYYLKPKTIRLSMLCETTAWYGKTALYCDDFFFNITEKTFLDIPQTKWLLTTEAAVVTQGTCEVIP
jgi:hypothetical protein